MLMKQKSTQREQQIMDNLFLAHEFGDRRYFRLYEVAEISCIPKNYITRVLNRLVRRGWIEKTRTYSISGIEPDTSGVFHLLGTNDLKTISLPIEVTGKPSKKLKQIVYTNAYGGLMHYTRCNRSRPKKIIKKLGSGGLGFPKEIIEDFKNLLEDKIRNSKIYYRGVIGDSSGISLDPTTYKERNKIIQRGKVKGREALWRETLKDAIPKEYTFYRLVQYPYLLHKHEAHIYKNRNEKESIELPNWDKSLPKGTKRFWKKASTELRLIIKSQNEPRLNLLELVNKQQINA